MFTAPFWRAAPFPSTGVTFHTYGDTKSNIRNEFQELIDEYATLKVSCCLMHTEDADVAGDERY